MLLIDDYRFRLIYKISTLSMEISIFHSEFFLLYLQLNNPIEECSGVLALNQWKNHWKSLLRIFGAKNNFWVEMEFNDHFLAGKFLSENFFETFEILRLNDEYELYIWDSWINLISRIFFSNNIRNIRKFKRIILILFKSIISRE